MKRILITGAAGLVGENIVVRLRQQPDIELVCIDKHPANSAIFRATNPNVEFVEANLAINDESWVTQFSGIDTVITSHAQISSLRAQDFVDNNITATANVLDAMARYSVRNLIHISSSVIRSSAVDHYTETKAAQETLVTESGLTYTVLRPTLMFGWFDRKHLGWLARFMRRTPLFPIPGDGHFVRQPLYVGDFSKIIISLITSPRPDQIYDISGLEAIPYIDLMKLIRDISGSRTRFVHLPYNAFWRLLQAYAMVFKDPPFTTDQLEALVIPEEFPVIDWPEIFGVTPTPLRQALDETLNDPMYSKVVLEF